MTYLRTVLISATFSQITLVFHCKRSTLHASLKKTITLNITGTVSVMDMDMDMVTQAGLDMGMALAMAKMLKRRTRLNHSPVTRFKCQTMMVPSQMNHSVSRLSKTVPR